MAKPADLLSVEEALERILSRFQRLRGEVVPLADVSGRVLTGTLTAPLDVPPFANSSMDGFALSSPSTAGATSEHPISLPVAFQLAAGSASHKSIGPGQCARIMTGAPLPAGADAVVPFEDVRDRGDSITLMAPVPESACVRSAGQDVKKGKAILPAGTVLAAPQVALLAALGFGHVDVVRRPVVAILSTGDELVNPGQSLGPGQIYNSNTPMLASAVAEAGGLPLVLQATADDARAIADALKPVRRADLLLTSGGASVGDFDYVKDVIGQGGELSFWRVRVRPGKPLLFGSMGPTPVIGLPGNPTSAMVTFEQFARPAIRTMVGASTMRPTIDVIVDDHIENRGGRRTFFRVQLRSEEGRWHATLAGPQDSAMLAPLARCDGLLDVPEDRTEIIPGESGPVQVWRLPLPG